MSELASDQVTIDQVRAAAALVGLALTEDDTRDVAALLSQWIPAAVRLSTRMQTAALDRLAPITAFASAQGTDPVGGPS